MKLNNFVVVNVVSQQSRSTLKNYFYDSIVYTEDEFGC